MFLKQPQLFLVVMIVLCACWLIHKTNKLVDYGLVGSYILLTLFFIMLNGITNDGSPRIFFLGSVTITLAISALLILKKKTLLPSG